MVGVVTGTYSSIYVAAPILLWLVGKHKELRRLTKNVFPLPDQPSVGARRVAGGERLS